MMFRPPLKNPPRPVSGYGKRSDPFGSGAEEWHYGIDYAVPDGTPVYAAADGVVLSTGTGDGSFGERVWLAHGAGYTSVCGHLTSSCVAEGQHVTAGELIGFSGHSGHATGPHVHFEVRRDEKPVDPAPLMSSGGGFVALVALAVVGGVAWAFI